MKICAQCGASGSALTRSRLAMHDTVVLGMPVTLVNAVDRFTCECGHSSDVTANNEGLIAAVALCRITMPIKLNGAEIRLLRKTLDLKAVDFAAKLDVTPESVSRWENSAELIGPQNEKTLRLRVALALQSKAPAIRVDFEELLALEISPLRPANWPTLYLEVVRMKTDTKKESQWDKTDEKEAA